MEFEKPRGCTHMVPSDIWELQPAQSNKIKKSKIEHSFYNVKQQMGYLRIIYREI